MYETRWRLFLGAVVVLGLVVAPGLHAEGGSLPVVTEFLTAFNDHDPEAMAELLTPDFELYYVVQGEVSLAATGPGEVAEQMKGYFVSLPTVRSEIVDSVDGPRFVSVRERASWESESGPRSQSSIAVYEIGGGKIARVWYFDAEEQTRGETDSSVSEGD